MQQFNFSSQKNFPFWLLTIAVFLAVCVSQLIQDGMFMDGMIYVCVGKNLANGLGTFWHPNFSKTLLKIYHEQPPLMFGLEALFFKVLGSSLYVERFYSLVAAILNGFFISKIWRLWFNRQQQIMRYDWLPVFFWIITPVIFWAITNNMEENTMSVFVLGSVFFILNSLLIQTKKLPNLVIAGLFIVGATLCKGIQGAFPLVMIVLYWLFYRNISIAEVIRYSLILFAPFAVIYSLIFIYPVSFSSFQMYFHDRILNTFVNSGMATTASRFNIIKILFNQMIPVLAIIIIIYFIAYKQKLATSISQLNTKAALFFISIGLSGSIPLMITLEQRSFYLVTAIPYFSLAFAIYLAPILNLMIEKINTQNRSFSIFKMLSIILFILSFVFVLSKIGKVKRDKDVLQDVYTIGTIVPQGATIAAPLKIYSEWSLQAYLNRYFYISLDASGSIKKYMIIEKSSNGSTIPNRYKKLPLQTVKYDMYMLN